MTADKVAEEFSRRIGTAIGTAAAVIFFGGLMLGFALAIFTGA